MASSHPIDRRRSELSPAQRALLEQRLRGQRQTDAATAHRSIQRRAAGVTAAAVVRAGAALVPRPAEPGRHDLQLHRHAAARLRRRRAGPGTQPERDRAATRIAADDVSRRRTACRCRSWRRRCDLPLPVIDLRHLPQVGARRRSAPARPTEEADVRSILRAGRWCGRRWCERATAGTCSCSPCTTSLETAGRWACSGRSSRPSGRPSSGTAVTAAELPIQYADFAVWQRNTMAGDEPAAPPRILASAAPGPSGPQPAHDCPRPPVQTFRGARLPTQRSVGR